MTRTADKATRTVGKERKQEAYSETKENAGSPGRKAKVVQPIPIGDRTKQKSTKTALVLSLRRRKGGVSSVELMEVTGWRAPSLRGFLSGALRKLSQKNLANLTPHPLYSAVYYSHPTLVERERALQG